MDVVTHNPLLSTLYLFFTFFNQLLYETFSIDVRNKFDPALQAFMYPAIGVVYFYPGDGAGRYYCYRKSNSR